MTSLRLDSSVRHEGAVSRSAPAPVGRRSSLFRAADRVVRSLLASRLHGLFSRRQMLLTYPGHQPGRRVTLPIGYFGWGPGTVLAMSSLPTWVPDLLARPTVRLRIRGHEHDAVPTVIEDRSAVAETFAEFAHRKGAREAKLVGLPGDRAPTIEELHAASLNTRLVVFRLVT